MGVHRARGDAGVVLPDILQELLTALHASLPLLDAVGGKGMYIATDFTIDSEQDGEALATLVEL